MNDFQMKRSEPLPSPLEDKGIVCTDVRAHERASTIAQTKRRTKPERRRSNRNPGPLELAGALSMGDYHIFHCRSCRSSICSHSIDVILCRMSFFSSGFALDLDSIDHLSWLSLGSWTRLVCFDQSDVPIVESFFVSGIGECAYAKGIGYIYSSSDMYPF